MKTIPRSFALLALSAFLVSPTAAVAQVGPGPYEAGEALSYDQIVDRFFDTLVEEDGTDRALDELYASSPYAGLLSDALTKIKGQLGQFPDMMGELHDHERLTTRKLTDRFVHVWEVAYFDRQPMSFYFTFYRPKDRWQIYSMDFTGELPVLLKEMAHQEMLMRTEAP